MSVLVSCSFNVVCCITSVMFISWCVCRLGSLSMFWHFYSIQTKDKKKLLICWLLKYTTIFWEITRVTKYNRLYITIFFHWQNFVLGWCQGILFNVYLIRTWNWWGECCIIESCLLPLDQIDFETEATKTEQIHFKTDIYNR